MNCTKHLLSTAGFASSSALALASVTFGVETFRSHENLMEIRQEVQRSDSERSPIFEKEAHRHTTESALATVFFGATAVCASGVSILMLQGELHAVRRF